MPSHQPSGPERLLLVTSVYREANFLGQIGREAYSYRFVYRAFAPLLERWARTVEFAGTEAELDAALAGHRAAGREPVHLSFLPLHMMRVAPGVANVGVPAWEYPDLPNRDLDGDPRNNWARVSGQLAAVITHTQFSRVAFVRAGVPTPVHVVPVPIDPRYHAVPDWQPGQTVRLDFPAYVFPQPEVRSTWPVPAVPTGGGSASAPRGLRGLYKRQVKPRLPSSWHQFMGRVARSVRAGWDHFVKEGTSRCPFRPRESLELTGVVYASVLNPFDGRKNWEDLLSGFLWAMRDRADATLVIKLIVCPESALAGLKTVLEYYFRFGLPHRCRLALVTEYLSDQQMEDLARASTYYVNTSKAEGSCLPLQAFLAAGRPAVAPPHTGMADCFGERVGFPIATHVEPTSWPQNRALHLETTSHRLVWQSYHDQLRRSYEVAHAAPELYQRMAREGRAVIEHLASPEQVWRPLAAALDDAWARHTGAAGRSREAA